MNQNSHSNWINKWGLATTTRTMPIHPPQAEAIDHKVGTHPRHQPQRKRLPFAEKANERNGNFRGGAILFL
jgi:hypothetical protein